MLVKPSRARDVKSVKHCRHEAALLIWTYPPPPPPSRLNVGAEVGGREFRVDWPTCSGIAACSDFAILAIPDERREAFYRAHLIPASRAQVEKVLGDPRRQL
jgi:hypothetical protein